jgi:uncharacterized membrane protein YcaP (DUF421 family)
VLVLAASINDSLLRGGVPVAEKLVRTIVVYFVVVVLLRLFGRRGLAELNSFDFVVLLLLSNVVQNAIIGPDNTLIGGVIGAATLVIINEVAVRSARRFGVLTWLFEGRSTVLVAKGEPVEKALEHVGLTVDEALELVRSRGADAFSDVDQAMLLPTGAIEVILNKGDRPATRGDIDRIESKLDQLLAGTK